MIDAVLFDLHGVLTSSPWATLAGVGAASGRSEADILAVVVGPYGEDGDHPWHRLERGEIALVDYVREVTALAETAGFPLDFSALRGFNDAMRVDEAMVELVRELRAGGRRTALVTNNVREMADGWRALLDADALFDAVVDSSSVGVRKPDPAIYRIALGRLGVADPARAVFLDDVATNVEGARRAGLHGILVTSTEQATAELDTLIRQRGG